MAYIRRRTSVIPTTTGSAPSRRIRIQIPISGGSCMNHPELISTASIHSVPEVVLTLNRTVLVCSDVLIFSFPSMFFPSALWPPFQPCSFRSFPRIPVFGVGRNSWLPPNSQWLVTLPRTLGHAVSAVGRYTPSWSHTTLPKFKALLVTVILLALRSTLDSGSTSASRFPFVGHDIASGFT